MRNAAAHPDVGLSHHIAEFVLGSGAAGHRVERLGSLDVAEQKREETVQLQSLQKALQTSRR